MDAPTWLRQLVQEGVVAWSAVNSQEGQRILEVLRSLDLVGIAIQGRQRRIHAINRGGLQRWFEHTYPAVPADLDYLPQRAQAVARHGSSKAGHATHAVQPILLRWFDPDQQQPWAVLTQENGLVGLTSDRLTTKQPPAQYWLLTVENWESFVSVSYQSPRLPIMVLYLGGQVSDIVVQACAALTPGPLQALHFGDYDWTGLAIYRRLRAALPLIRLYVPPTLAELFARYSSRHLLEGQIPLRFDDLDDQNYQQVIRLIQEWNGGLEQEIVPLPPLGAFYQA
jgi:hypothetical protein